MTEMAYSGIGFNPHYGTPKNACSDDIHYSPGGSSSGSGAVIGRNMVPIAIGSDTGGSVRVQTRADRFGCQHRIMALSG